MDYKKLILDMLLDKYEESKHYRGDAKVNRRISLFFSRKTFPQYDIENTEVKDSIHHVLYELRDKNIISIQWMRFEEGNLVDKIFLNIENIDNAYIEANRKPGKDVVSDTIEKMKDINKSIRLKWIQYFIEDQIQQMEDKKKLTKYIPGDEHVLELLLNSLKGIDDLDGDETLERVFSKRYLGNSKLFETKVRSRLCTILRDYCFSGEGLEDEDLLQEAGIIKNAEELLFFGPLTIKLSGKTIDFTPFCFGASMNTETIKNFTVESLNVNRVITIENKANYIEFIKREKNDDTIVIYLGGFYSPVKRIFLKKIYDHVKNMGMKVQFIHWGDIDLGGFNIYMQLKSKLIKELVPLYMDVDTLRKYADNGDKFDLSYGKKLKKLLENKEYEVFHEVIREMLKLSIKLEQEALL